MVLDRKPTATPDLLTFHRTLFHDEVTEASALMEAQEVRRLPILNRAKQLVGILSLVDLAVRTQGTEDQDPADEALKDISAPT